VNLEIACGAVNTVRLEQALRNAEFEPDRDRVWRWVAQGTPMGTVVKFELLADLDTAPAGATVAFDTCEELGAVNLRGTGFAARDIVVQELRARIGDLQRTVEINVTGLAGYVLAKTAAAYSRRELKDWYDLAFVLLHNDIGGPSAAADAVRGHFGDEIVGSIRTALDDLVANFASPSAQGPQGYASQMLVDHPELGETTLLADAVVGVGEFHSALLGAY